MTAASHCAIIILGAGSAGRACLQELRSRDPTVDVCIVESDINYGGTCMNRGCFGKKALYEAAVWRNRLFTEELGVDVRDTAAAVDYATLADRTRRLTRRNSELAFEIDTAYNHTRVLLGDARFERGPGGAPRLRVRRRSDGSDALFTYEQAVIATGGRPSVPRSLSLARDVELGEVSSDAVFAWDALPDTLAVVGAGYIGTEFAGIFAALGVPTTLYARSAALRSLTEDDAVSGAIEDAMTRAHPTLRVERAPVSAVRRASGLFQRWRSVRPFEVVTPEGTSRYAKVIVATGRAPNVEALNLSAVGLSVSARGIATDSHFETGVRDVFAVGDVSDTVPKLTSTASIAGRVVARAILARRHSATSRPAVPVVALSADTVQQTVFTIPGPYAQVGRDVVTATRRVYTVRTSMLADARPDAFVPTVYSSLDDGIVRRFAMHGGEASSVASWFTARMRETAFNVSDVAYYPFMYPTDLAAAVRALRSQGSDKEPCCMI